MNNIKFDRFPYVPVADKYQCSTGWDSIINTLMQTIESGKTESKIVVVEYYQGVIAEEITEILSEELQPHVLIDAKTLMLDPGKIHQMVYPDVTDDRIFGYLSRLTIDQYFDEEKIAERKASLNLKDAGLTLIVGSGAAYVAESILPEDHLPYLLIYADMARWEIQARMRRHQVDSLGLYNRDVEDWMLLYKQGYFVDWRVCDRLKKQLMNRWDFVLDTNNREAPKLVPGQAILDGLEAALRRPFSVVPFFDPGPWGGQWMRAYCNLDPEPDNYAWCFNCVPEENSLMLKIDGEMVEIPSINLVFYKPQALLGDPVHARFGDEFPIRFDFLDTMDGGNLSLQVHPLTEYIQEHFGMHYTQDESYYMLDAKADAVVYLGFKEGVNPDHFIQELKAAQTGGPTFEPEKFVNTLPVKKHDHYLIPAGTIHCSGKDSMVLEISATPYIFTFKLWDWGRLGLDGKPRPINIGHGEPNLMWDRDTQWVNENLANRFEKVAEGKGWIEEKTGLHEREFIETRRHWFSEKVEHETGDSVNVLNLVEGDEAVVESPEGAFDPFVVHYAETFIVPACVGRYTIRPHGSSEGKTCGTIKAFVRHRA